MSKFNAVSCCFGQISILILNLFLQPLLEVVFIGLSAIAPSQPNPSSAWHRSFCAHGGGGSLGFAKWEFGSGSCLGTGLGSPSIPPASSPLLCCCFPPGFLK